MYILFHSTTALSLVEGLQGSAFSTAMPGHGTQCAYVDCKRTTDKRAFGHVNTLTAEHQLVYSTWLKSSHDGVVCNSHYIALRRQLTKQRRRNQWHGWHSCSQHPPSWTRSHRLSFPVRYKWLDLRLSQHLSHTQSCLHLLRLPAPPPCHCCAATIGDVTHVSGKGLRSPVSCLA